MAGPGGDPPPGTPPVVVWSIVGPDQGSRISPPARSHTPREVWAYQVNPMEVSVGDPVDLSKRLDGTTAVRMN